MTKDHKFNRTRAFNQRELLEIEADDSSYYAQRCIDVASNTLTSRLVNQRSRFLNRKAIAIDPKQIIREDDGTFTVPSETRKEVFYSVDMELRICSCPDGVLRGPCKHRKLVAQSQNMLSWEASPEMRALWMELGTGKKTNLDYFQPLSDPHIPNCIGDSISTEEGEAEDVELAEDQTLDEMNIDNEIEDGNENEILQDNSERIKIANEKLDDVLESIRELFKKRIPHNISGYEKALKSIKNHVNRLPMTNDGALQKALHTFGQIESESLTGGKRKKGSKFQFKQQVLHGEGTNCEEAVLHQVNEMFP